MFYSNDNIIDWKNILNTEFFHCTGVVEMLYVSVFELQMQSLTYNFKSVVISDMDLSQTLCLAESLENQKINLV